MPMMPYNAVRNGTSLQLDVSFHQGDHGMDLEELVRIACGLHVRELVIKNYCEDFVIAGMTFRL